MHHDREIVSLVDALDAKFKFVNTGAKSRVLVDPETREVRHEVVEPTKIRCDILCKNTSRRFAQAFGGSEAEALANAVVVAESAAKLKTTVELAAENEELKRRLRLAETGGNPLAKPKRGTLPPPEEPKPKNPEDDADVPSGEKPWHDGMVKQDLRQLLTSNGVSIPGNIGFEKLVEMVEEHGLHQPIPAA